MGPSLFYKELSSALIFSVPVGTLIMVLLRPQQFTSWQGLQQVWPSLLMSIAYTIFLGWGNGYLDRYINRFVRWIDQPVRRLVVSVLAMLLYSFLAIVMIQFVFAKLIWEDRCDCTLGWDDYYVPNMTFPLIITVIITTVLFSRKFLLEWRRAAIETERLRSEQLASQYQSLKDQMNPHFLFNSLNALTYLVYENQDQAALFIRKLSEVYRYVLDTRDREVVPLAEELDFVRAYVFLQKIRFEDALQVTWEIPDDSSYCVPPLALQMLLENAIKHNELSDAHPLQITIRQEDEGQLLVENNARPKELQEPSSGIGLENIRARYRFLTEAPVTVVHQKHVFSVSLPLLRTESASSVSRAVPAVH